MMNESSIEKKEDALLHLSGVVDLLGKKSVRATFKLHPTAIELLSVLAAHLGIKQKSLFDYLMEDEDALRALAASLPSHPAAKQPRIKKTFVVSQRSLAALEAVTKNSPASRDDLIERSIQRLLPILEKERIRYKRRTDALTKIRDHFKQGKVLMDDVKEMVGEEDALYQSLVAAIAAYTKAVAEMEKRIAKGKRISKFSRDGLAWNPFSR